VLVSADWVLPVSRPPIREGAVVVRGDTVAAVGPAEKLATEFPAEKVVDLGGCIIAPGLVNAHTHLALSMLGGLTRPGPLHPWLRPVTRVILGFAHEEFGVSSAAGALESLRSGTTVVGDIVYGAETPAAVEPLGLAGVYLWELLGIDPEGVADSLGNRGYAPPATTRVRPGLSPHAPYSSGPRLLRYVRQLAREGGQPFVIHVAEAQGEVELTLHGTGRFRDQADRLARGFETPSSTPVAYLDSLGVLDDAVCVHCVHIDEADASLIARKARGVVLCPRSNAFLENGTPPVGLMRAAGVRLAIGTDSSASNDDLDLFEEARTVSRIDPTIPPAEILKMMTEEGARLLGLADAFGTLEAGMQADLIAVEASVSPGVDPQAAFLEAGGADRMRRVMSAGEWRVVDGEYAEAAMALRVQHEAAHVRDHASELIAAE